MPIDFGVKTRIEGEYARRINRIFGMINKAINGLNAINAAKAIEKIIASPTFDRLVNSAVLNMITMVKADNARTWRKAAEKGSYGRKIYEALNAEVGKKKTEDAIRQILMENAQLIKSVPADVANRITRMVFEEQVKGQRVPEIAKKVKGEAPWISGKRAVLIARTESSKTNAILTEVRSREFGSDWYIWRSSHDERVRSSHRFMDGVFVHWDAEPNPETLSGEKNKFGRYHAGCCPNCRCYAEPLIHESQVPNRCRVYRGGGVISMGKRQFMEIWGQQEVA